MKRGSYFIGTCLALSLGVMPHAEAAEQPYQVEWIRQIGTASPDYSYSMAVDAVGNAYISGYTHGSLGGTNAGYSDAFLTKFDPSGAELWSTQIGTAGDDWSTSVAVDAAGNAYISGRTNGLSAGNQDAFLTKFDPSGNELWSTQTDTNWNYSTSVAVDTARNTYISGYTYGNFNGTYTVLPDAFLIKFDPTGNELWSTQIGTPGDDESFSVAVDAAGNAYISGYTDGSLDDGTYAGNYDAFLAKFDPAGNKLWSTQIGTPGDDGSSSVAVDAAGYAYISGYTRGSLGGPSAGNDDAFLTKFDPAGNELWSTQIGTASRDASTSVGVDAAGNAYISGRTEGSLGGPSAGDFDAFLAKFDPSGNELWSAQVGTTSTDFNSSVAVDAAGNAYISGWTHGSFNGPSAGGVDAFLIKFAIPEPASVALLTFGFPALLRRR